METLLNQAVHHHSKGPLMNRIGLALMLTVKRTLGLEDILTRSEVRYDGISCFDKYTQLEFLLFPANPQYNVGYQ
jgi:hypothetical protein